MVLTEQGIGNVKFYPFNDEAGARAFIKTLPRFLAAILLDAGGCEVESFGWNHFACESLRRVAVPVYTITNVNSGKVLNVEGGSTDNGANVKQWDNPTSLHSQWRIASCGADTGTVIITNVNSDKVLNVSGGSTDNGANVQLWDNPESPESQWRIASCDTGTVIITNVHSGKVLNVAGGNKDNGANVKQWDNPESADSQWKLKKM